MYTCLMYYCFHRKQQDSSLLLTNPHSSSSSSLRTKVTTALNIANYIYTVSIIIHCYSVPDLLQPVIALLRDNLPTLLCNNLVTMRVAQFGYAWQDNGSLISNNTIYIISILIYVATPPINRLTPAIGTAQSLPAQSCNQVHQQLCSNPPISGVYWINTSGIHTIQVRYC